MNHKHINTIILCFSLFFISSSIHSQSAFGGHPSYLKWQQINTPYVRVIYPKGLEQKAQRVANTIHYLNDKNIGLLGKKRKKVDIVLQNQQVISNGFAQIAPFKTEFFMQAPQTTFGESAVDWLDLLSIHEYRHINQFTNTNRGISKVLKFIFGDYGLGAAIGATAPAWFVEGDAVVIETALTNSGRGRIPSFSVSQRALEENGIRYSYMKAMNGSYKDLVPNHYHSGYAILSEIRRTHGNEAWDTITNRAARFKGIIYPFPKAVTRISGKKVKAHYQNAYDSLKMSIPEKPILSTPITNPENKNVLSYNYPILENGVIYSSKSSRKRLNGIFKIQEDGAEELVVTRGLLLDANFDKHGEKFVWTELERDIRRGNQNYSNIILYNAATNKKSWYGRGQRFFTPSFSPDGNSIVFIESTVAGNSSISILNPGTNEITSRINSELEQFLYPIFAQDNETIFTIVKKGHVFSIAQVDRSGNLELITDWGTAVFGPLRLHGDHLIYNANYENRDNIYALNIKNGAINQISDDPIGLYHPSNVENNEFIAMRPHSRGFMLHKMKLDTNSNRRLSDSESLAYYLKDEHLQPNNILEKIPSQAFTTDKYKPGFHLFKPHSWLVLTDGEEISASIFSDNILNYFSFQPTYTYNRNANASFLDFSFQYGKWYPIIGLDYIYGFPRIQTTSDGENSFEVTTHSLRPTVEIPFVLTKGVYNKSLSLRTSLTFRSLDAIDLESQEEINQRSTSLGNILQYSAIRFKATQNFYPKYGIRSALYHRYRINDQHTVLNFSNDVYLPGFHVNHGFKFELDYQWKNDTGDEFLPLIDVFDYAEGFLPIEYDQVFGFNTNYGLPLLYPDWGFLDLLYFKRINGVMFHNYNYVVAEELNSSFNSVGVDLLFDLVFINNVFSEISVGLRSAYLLGEIPEQRKRPLYFELILDIPAF